MLKNLLRKKEGTASTSGVTLDPNNIPHHVAIIMDGKFFSRVRATISRIRPGR